MRFFGLLELLGSFNGIYKVLGLGFRVLGSLRGLDLRFRVWGLRFGA